MKTTKRLFLLVIALMSMSTMQAQDPNFWIFLCFGQSNMAGCAPIEAQDSIIPEDFLSLSATNGTDGRQVGKWRKALPPICRQGTKLSPVDYFGREILEKAPEGTRVGVISVAVEGCPITFFDKDACAEPIAKEERDWMNNILNEYDRNPYQRLVDMARIAQREGVIKGILLHQGETDAYNAEWQKRVYKIYKDLQEDLKLDTFSVPLLVGEVARAEYAGVCAHANPTIDDIVNHYHNVYVVSAEGCAPGDDHVHFSSEGYRQLGRNYAQVFLRRMGLDAAPRKTEVATKKIVTYVQAFSVGADINLDRMMTADANEPMEKVDIVSFSGQTIKTIDAGGGKTLLIDLKQLPRESLIFVFKSKGGDTSTIKLEY